jgi:hypothetical protein
VLLLVEKREFHAVTAYPRMPVSGPFSSFLFFDVRELLCLAAALPCRYGVPGWLNTSCAPLKNCVTSWLLTSVRQMEDMH